MGSILTFLVAPTPLGHGADDRLAAGLHGHVLDPDHLLALAAMAVQGLDQGGVGAGELVAVLQAHFAAGEGLLAQGGAAKAFHSRLMHGEHLGGEQPLQRACSPALKGEGGPEDLQAQFGRGGVDRIGIVRLQTASGAETS